MNSYNSNYMAGKYLYIILNSTGGFSPVSKFLDTSGISIGCSLLLHSTNALGLTLVPIISHSLIPVAESSFTMRCAV